MVNNLHHQDFATNGLWLDFSSAGVNVRAEHECSDWGGLGWIGPPLPVRSPDRRGTRRWQEGRAHCSEAKKLMSRSAICERERIDFLWCESTSARISWVMSVQQGSSDTWLRSDVTKTYMVLQVLSALFLCVRTKRYGVDGRAAGGCAAVCFEQEGQ